METRITARGQAWQCLDGPVSGNAAGCPSPCRPKGSGMTFVAEQTSTALGLDFYAISVAAKNSKRDILGYMHANTASTSPPVQDGASAMRLRQVVLAVIL